MMDIVPKLRFMRGVTLAGVIIPGTLHTQYDELVLYKGCSNDRLIVADELCKFGLKIKEINSELIILQNPGNFCIRPISSSVNVQHFTMPSGWTLDYEIIESRRVRQ
jgi:hypothetical protein